MTANVGHVHIVTRQEHPSLNLAAVDAPDEKIQKENMDYIAGNVPADKIIL